MSNIAKKAHTFLQQQHNSTCMQKQHLTKCNLMVQLFFPSCLTNWAAVRARLNAPNLQTFLNQCGGYCGGLLLLIVFILFFHEGQEFFLLFLKEARLMTILACTNIYHSWHDTQVEHLKSTSPSGKELSLAIN